MRELVDVHYPDAACIRIVQDNLSIHKPGALYEAFAPAEALLILRRLEFHFTPKHASWLNMVECEISVLQRQCLGRRIDDPKKAPKPDRSMAKAPKQNPSQHQMDVHNRKSPRQTRPRLLQPLAKRLKITVMNH